ncbi:extracellular solute-binding protein [Aquamicrobium terrae]|uniref:Spermidine/putrescine transport system substrate-binding protein n=1 Tax=Aquamicrobium terrae TaxID=1324945 RepID=A0ABV2N3P4_9HYPH
MKKLSCYLIATALGSAFATIAIAQEITVMGYRGAFEENYVKAVIQPFEAAHPDIKVKYFGVQNAATSLGNMRAQKDAPAVNAVIYDLSVAKIASEEGLVEDISLDKLPNYADLSDIGKDLGGKAIPLTFDTLSLVYNTGVYPTPPDSWEELWNKKNDGMVILPAQGGGDIQAILLTIVANRMAGEEDYKKDIRPGIDKLIEVAPLVQTWEPKPDAYTLVADGTANISIGYNARAQFFFDSTGGRVASVAPKEGTAAQINVISQIAKSPDSDATQTFINYAISPEAQANFAKAMFYAPTNSKTELDPETSARIPFTDPEKRANLIDVDWMAIGDLRETFLTSWRREIIPAGR